MPNINLKKFSIIIISLSILIIAAAFIYRQIKYDPKVEQSSVTGKNQQIEGKLKSFRNDFLEKKIVIEKNNQNYSFKIDGSTIIYKCSDLKNINSCTKTDWGITRSKNVQIFARGEAALFILYK